MSDAEVVVVSYEDTVSNTERVRMQDLNKNGLIVRQSFGLFFEENEIYLCLIHDKFYDGETDWCSDYAYIPKGCVLDIKRFKL